MSRIKDMCISEPVCNIHPNILLDGLNKLRENGKFIDVILSVNGEEYKAHRAVLSACSDYFSAMFHNNMMESQQKLVTLHGLPHTGFYLLFNYIYTSKLELTANNVQDVLATAMFLQIQPVINACINYLLASLNKDNCVDIATIADNFCLTNLQRTVYKFICAHFPEIAITRTFYGFAPEHIENILKLNLPINCSEVDVLQYVLLWFLHGESTEMDHRLQHAHNILKHIRYNIIHLKTLHNVLDKVFHKAGINKEGHSLYKIILEEVRQPPLSLDMNACYPTFNPRGIELALIKVGGFNKSGITNEVTRCMMNEKTWEHLTFIPHVEQSNFGTSVLNNNLYVVGGCFNQSLREHIHSYGFKYNPIIDQWSKIEPMNVERCRFTLNVCGDKLYAIGGATDVDCFDGMEGTQTCECYNSVDGTWNLIKPLPEYRMQHASASVTVNGKEKIFISGGVYRDNVVASLYCLDIETQTWKMCAPMLTPRADHSMLSYGHKLYVCGGWREDSRLGSLRRIQVDTIDSYNILLDRWELVTVIPTPRYHAAVVAVNSKIYIMGGFHTDALFYKDTAAVECYNIATDNWTFGDKCSLDYWEHSCVTLYIPKHDGKDKYNDNKAMSS